MITVAWIDQAKADALLSWALKNITEPETIGGNPTGRLARWYGLGVEMKSLNWQSWSVYQSEPITDGLKRLATAIDPTMSFNSVLAYRYPPGVGIGRHVDKPLFTGDVTLLHLCSDTRPKEIPLFPPLVTEPSIAERATTDFLYGVSSHPIKVCHGEAVRFIPTVEHAAPACPEGVTRVSIQFRNVGVAT